MDNPTTFEQAMSLLVAAIGHTQNNLPTTDEESMRLAEQVSRLDTIWVRNQGRLLSASA